MEQRVPVPLGEGESIGVIVLGLTRGTHRLRTVSPPARGVQELRGSFLVEWPPSAQPRRAQVTFDTWGAPMVVAGVDAYTPSGFLALESLPGATEPATLEEWRRKATAAESDHCLARDFFNELDERTLAWSEERDNLQELLSAYYSSRWKGVDDPLSSSTPGQEILDTLTDTAQMFTELFERFANVEEIRDAFDLFARGELSLLGSGVALPSGVNAEDAAHACQPDSTLHYLYAELAQAILHHGITTTGGYKFPSPGVWNELLPTLVHSHRLFCEAYGVAGKYDHRKPTTGILPPGKSLNDVRGERGLALPVIQADVRTHWCAQLRSDVTDV